MLSKYLNDLEKANELGFYEGFPGEHYPIGLPRRLLLLLWLVSWEIRNLRLQVLLQDFNTATMAHARKSDALIHLLIGINPCDQTLGRKCKYLCACRCRSGISLPPSTFQ